MGWSLKLFPTAGEAILTWERRPAGDLPASEPEPALEQPREREAEYAQRATGNVRRWIRANKCAYLWTFTFREPVFDYAYVAQAVDRFLRRLAEFDFGRPARDASSPAFLLVPEPHPHGHGWHLHGATDRYLPHRVIAELWAEGFVFVTRGATGKRGWAPRRLSRYLAKYIGKSLADSELHGCWPRPAGAHRYWVTQGRNPVVLRSWHATIETAVGYLRRTYGREDAWFEFGLDDDAQVPGIWFDFPDAAIDGWAERVKAESRAQRGQP